MNWLQGKVSGNFVRPRRVSRLNGTLFCFVCPMNLADVFTVVFVVVALLTGFVACWLMVAGLFPRRVAGCATELGAAPFRCLLVGALTLVPLIGLGVLGSRTVQSAPGKIATVLLVVAGLLLALVGAAGLAMRLGQGLPAERDRLEPWRRVLRGGVVLAFTFLSVVMLPVTLCAGFGAFILTSLRRQTPSPANVPAVA